MNQLIVLAALLAATIAMAQTFTPRPIDDILPNPHMGWQTFHGPAKNDRALPNWIPSTVMYARFGWKEFEPVKGQLNTEFIETQLNLAAASGQTLATRIMTCSSSPNSPYHPAWLKEIAGGTLTGSYENATLEVPNLDNPAVLEAHLDLIRRFAEKYDGDPRLDHMDLGSVGWWGEWHMSGSKELKMPTPETCRKIVDTYLQSFRKTPVIALIGGGEQTAYAAAQGAGWRADCLGDLGGFSKNWCHMRKGYPEWFRAAKLDETWKRSPVAYESCWDMRKWVSEGWPLRYIFNYALATHASYLNNKSAPLPDSPEVRPEIERFLKRLGYRLIIKQADVAIEGGTVRITSTWQNLGSAPCYRPYRVAWRLTNADGKVLATQIAETDITTWMPGSVDVFTPEFIANPPDLPDGPENQLQTVIALPNVPMAGDHTLSVAIVDPQTHQPAIRLAIDGRQPDGWYPLGKVQLLKLRL